MKHACLDLRRLRSAPQAGPVDFSLPVGLNNIGNTCYLNSLLQYLYTVEAVRDIVLNFDDVKLDLDDDSIERRRLGGPRLRLERGEAVVSQACKSQWLSDVPLLT